MGKKEDGTIVKKTYPVGGMSCASCASSVQSMLESIEGVQSAEVNYANASANVEYIPGVDEAKFQEAIQSIGYELHIPEEEGADDWEAIARNRLKDQQRKSIAALVLMLPVMVISMFFPDIPYADFIMLALTLPVIFWSGADFYVRAVKQLKHAQASMDTLVALSTGIAFIFSIFNMIYPDFWENRGLEAYTYFEAAGVIIAFVGLGKLLEERARSATSGAIKKLMELQPSEAQIYENNEWKWVPVESIKPGDRIRVANGDKIPVDGQVLSGTSYLDESMVTGESMPAFKAEGAKVYAGTIVSSNPLEMEATSVGKETILSGIIERVKEAQASKPPVQMLVDKVASVFVPVVIAIAILTLLLWGIITGEWSLAIFAFITVLVIACPCALGLATPTAIMASIGKGARLGILTRDASSLEKAGKVHHLVLDKTGTLTSGDWKVSQLIQVEEDDQELQVLKGMEEQSSHPLAHALVAYLHNHKAVKVEDIEEVPGKGMVAALNGHHYKLGSIQFVSTNDLMIPEGITVQWDKAKSDPGTVIAMSKDNTLSLFVQLHDEVKEDAAETIQELDIHGIQLHILSGDRISVVEALASQLGISNYHGEVLPGEKAEYIKALKKEGKVVAMVGDGINDSEALALSDVSIAMSGGSGVAIETAQLTILSDRISRVSQAVRLSRKTDKIIRQNLFWAFIYNIIGIPLAAGVLYPAFGLLLNPMVASAAMALSSVSVVLNSLRLRSLKI